MSARDDYPLAMHEWQSVDVINRALDEIDRLRANELNPSPSVWPACSECKQAFRLEHRMQMHMEDESWQIRPIWAWIRNCKHKKADAVVYNAEGPVEVEP